MTIGPIGRKAVALSHFFGDFLVFPSAVVTYYRYLPKAWEPRSLQLGVRTAFEAGLRRSEGPFPGGRGLYFLNRPD